MHSALTNYLVSLLQSRWRGYALRKKFTDGWEDAAGGPAEGHGGAEHSAGRRGDTAPPAPA